MATSFIPVNEPLLDGNEKAYLAECINNAHHLMTRGNVASLREQVAFGKMQIGSADPAAGDLDSNLLGGWGRSRAFQPSQRPVVDRPRLAYGPSVHHAILASLPPWKEAAPAPVLTRVDRSKVRNGSGCFA